jgi:ribosome modulation factor
MIIFAMRFVGSSLVLNVAAAVPTYNVKPTCRAAIDLSGVTGRTAEMCEASEAKARGEIVKGWSGFSESTKDRCLQTSAGLAPCYVELLICLESMRDAQKRQDQEKPPAAATKKR